MALIDCPECSRKISDAAPACPGCGYPIAAKSDASNDLSNTAVPTKPAGCFLQIVGAPFVIWAAANIIDNPIMAFVAAFVGIFLMCAGRVPRGGP